MRAIWKGSISFGLVYIPIAVYPATKEEKLSFRQLRATDLSPIKYKKVAEADSKEVAADQIVKGYEYERGHYVVLKDEDFAKVKIESTHSIDITDFVELGQVDPKFFYKPYFLEPQKGGEKAYALLHRALAGTGKIGIAKVVISNREHLASVKPDGLFLDPRTDAFRFRDSKSRGTEERADQRDHRKRIEDGAIADRKHVGSLGAGKIPGRIPDRGHGNDRAEGAAQGGRGQAHAGHAGNQRGRSREGASGKPEPESIDQTETKRQQPASRSTSSLVKQKRRAAA